MAETLKKLIVRLDEPQLYVSHDRYGLWQSSSENFYSGKPAGILYIHPNNQTTPRQLDSYDCGPTTLIDILFNSKDRMTTDEGKMMRKLLEKNDPKAYTRLLELTRCTEDGTSITGIILALRRLGNYKLKLIGEVVQPEFLSSGKWNNFEEMCEEKERIRKEIYNVPLEKRITFVKEKLESLYRPETDATADTMIDELKACESLLKDGVDIQYRLPSEEEIEKLLEGKKMCVFKIQGSVTKHWVTGPADVDFNNIKGETSQEKIYQSLYFGYKDPTGCVVVREKKDFIEECLINGNGTVLIVE